MKKLKTLNTKSVRKLLNDKTYHYFFGYYNLTPWNKSMKKMLCCRAKFLDRYPTTRDALEIGLIEDGKFVKLCKSHAWNWQQGCMLQWIPGSENKIIFNDYQNNKIVSVVFNIETKKRKIIPYPIYSLHPTGGQALSLSFSRLFDTRKAYGYSVEIDKHSQDSHPNDDGVYLIDLKTKKKSLIISLDQLSKINPQSSMGFGRHWINHLSFSPDGKKFCFFYRWELPNGLFYTRLVISDTKGRILRIFSDGEFSHVDWISNTELLGWASTSKTLSKIKGSKSWSEVVIKKILPLYRIILPKSLRNRVSSQGYKVFNWENGSVKKINLWNRDGHPSISPNKKFIITDTYPDKKGYNNLILFDMRKKTKRVIGKFYSVPHKKYLSKKITHFGDSPFRSDLHPKWSPDSKSICVDSVCGGNRNMYEVAIDE